MPFLKWGDVGAFTCFVDRVGVYQLRAFQECSYGPLARAMPLMLSEEQLHLNFGASVLRRMVQDGPKYSGSKEEAQSAVNKWYPRALDMFGHSNSETSQPGDRVRAETLDQRRSPRPIHPRSDRSHPRDRVGASASRIRPPRALGSSSNPGILPGRALCGPVLPVPTGVSGSQEA